MKVAFRADASVQIGTGHVMRCLALADELTRQGHSCRFVCRDHEGHLGELIVSKGHELTLLPGPRSLEQKPLDHTNNAYSAWLGCDWETDARQCADVFSEFKPDWLVVDHYALDYLWENAARCYAQRLLAIDDLADRVHSCDLLLDQNLGRKEEDYQGLVPDKCSLIIGPRYALLRPEFSRLREKSLQRRQNPELNRILISLGGVDRTNVTGQVLAALSETPLSPEIRLDIVMGSSAPALEQVQIQAETLPFQATVSVNVTDMAERMCLADLSIGAAGSMSWERCCLGLPAIMIILAENQRLIGEALARVNSAFLVDDARIADDLGLLVLGFAESNTDLGRFARNAAEICDGGGTARLVSIMTRSDVS